MRTSKNGSYLRRIDSCITQLKAQGPSGTCNASKEEEEESKNGCWQILKETPFVEGENLVEDGEVAPEPLIPNPKP